MKAIESLLDKLQQRINSYEVDPLNYENKKNEMLEITNIFLLHGFNITLLDTDNILLLSNEELERIINIINPTKAEVLIDLYENKYIPTINLFAQVRGKYKDIPVDNPQETEALSEVDKLCKTIKSFVNEDIKRSEDYINSLKEASELPKRYLSYFSESKLTEAITNFHEFNGLLDSLDLSPLDKAQIKIEIGKSNCSLIKPLEFVPEEKLLRINKYKVVFEAKKARYNELYYQIKNALVALPNALVALPNALDSTIRLSNSLNISIEEAKQGVTCLLLDFYINDYNRALIDETLSDDERKEYLDLVVKNLDEVMDFSKKEIILPNEVAEEKPKEEAIKPVVGLSEVDKLINQCQSIIESESEVLSHTNDPKFNDYTNDQLYGTKTNEYTKEEEYLYNLLIYILSMMMSIDNMKPLDNNSKEYETEKNNLKESLSKYYELKGKGITSEESKEAEVIPDYKVIFLTDENGVPTIVPDLDKKENEDLKKLKKLLFENLATGNFGSRKKMGIPGAPCQLYYLYNTPVRVSYGVLPNNGLLVLSAAFNDGDIGDRTTPLTKTYYKKIDKLRNIAKSSIDLEMLYEEQAGIRKDIESKLISKQK